MGEKMIRIITTTYVPAVRWKGAERLALRSLPLSTRRRIVPLIELVPKDFLPFVLLVGFRSSQKLLRKRVGGVLTALYF